MKVEVRKTFGKITPNPYFWSGLIDSLDLVSNTIDAILLSVFGIGIATNLVFDVFQSFLALLIFEDGRIAILNADFMLPPAFDLLPSFTTNVYILENVIK